MPAYRLVFFERLEVGRRADVYADSRETLREMRAGFDRYAWAMNCLPDLPDKQT